MKKLHPCTPMQTYYQVNENGQTIFEEMLPILEEAVAKKYANGGRRSKLSVKEQLTATFAYYREGFTYAQIAKDYGLAESNIYRMIQWVRNVLSQNDNVFPAL
ncbi:hypothetical protein FACS1894111_09810 [Clostridia bacterium]|nr:hypothetical protein FACS1894111_09810 [Clostridia bacterium]